MGVATTCTAGTVNIHESLYQTIFQFCAIFLYAFDSGNYCPLGSSAVIRCPAGSWGSTTGLQTTLCTGQCTEGMFVLQMENAVLYIY